MGIICPTCKGYSDGRLLEYCIVCDEPTEKAGKGEDSLYAVKGEEEIGPLCEKCYDSIRRQTVDNKELYQEAYNAIKKLFSDTSVSQEETKANLQDLVEEINVMIESLV